MMRTLSSLAAPAAWASGAALLALFAVGVGAQEGGGYPARRACLPAQEQADLAAAFARRNAGGYLGLPSGVHPWIDVAVQALGPGEEPQLQADVKAGKVDLLFITLLFRDSRDARAPRCDAAAVAAAQEFLRKNAEPLGLAVEQVEARAVWVAGVGKAVGFALKEPAAAAGRCYSAGFLRERPCAVDALAVVVADPPVVRSFRVFARPVPADLKLAAAKLTPDEAKGKVVGSRFTVPQAGAATWSKEDRAITLAHLGPVREVVSVVIGEAMPNPVKGLLPAAAEFVRLFEIAVRSEPREDAPIVCYRYLDAVTGAAPMATRLYVPPAQSP